MRSIFLSAGHSNSDPGAVAQARTEAGIVTEVRNMVAFYLQRAQVPHELDGDGPINLPLRDAAAKARKHPLAVEFHCNAAATPAAAGVETLSGPKDMKLGAELCKAIAGAMGTKNRSMGP